MYQAELYDVFSIPLRARGFALLSVQFSATTNLSVRWKEERAGLKIWVSDYLEDAPFDVMHDFAMGIADYMQGREPVFGPAYSEFINSDEFVLRVRPVYVRRQRNIAMEEQGAHRNLIDSVQRLYDAGLLEDSDIRNTMFSWTVNPNYTRLGYCATFARMVTISTALDDPEVPEFVLDYVVFHESMHLRQGYRPFDSNPHDAQFRRWMKAFPRMKEAEQVLSTIPLKNPDRGRRPRRA